MFILNASKVMPARRVRAEQLTRGRFRLISSRLVATLLVLTTLAANVTATAELPAFPGAEGGGALAVGGRGGEVCKVTNLKDAGSGSLRDCVERQGPRTVIFEVGGTIELRSQIRIDNPYITIAGQTAPGGGIQLKADKSDWAGSDLFWVSAEHVIVRYVRFRMGDTGGDHGNVRVLSSNVIFDHCSIAWSRNQNWTIYTWSSSSGPKNVTLQNSIVTEMLQRRVNMLLGGAYGSGAALMENIDHHNNLIANSVWRNPLAHHGSGKWINNIIYNWYGWASRGVGGVHHDWVSNLWKPGPATKKPQGQQELQFVRYSEEHPNPKKLIDRPLSLYIEGNRGLLSGMSPETDNWPYTREAGPSDNGLVIGPTPLEWRRTEPLPPTAVAISAVHVDELEDHLLPIVGASKRLDCAGNWVTNRDSADERVIAEYFDNQGTLTEAGQGEEIYGGHPLLESGVPCLDSSGDGIPDAWAMENGLDPLDPEIANKVHKSGYTYLELYLSGMDVTVAPASPSAVVVD